MENTSKFEVLVIGTNARVFDEMDTINRSDFDCVIGVNMASLIFHPVDVLCTLHPEFFQHYKMPGLRMVSQRDCGGVVDEIFSHKWAGYEHKTSGTSGLYAVKYALQRLNATKVVLAGIGMDDCGHIYNEVMSFTADVIQYQKTWEIVLPELKDKVFSLGGWTKGLLNG
jgi:hypothetical protein